VAVVSLFNGAELYVKQISNTPLFSGNFFCSVVMQEI
jgi:hypothetical protein